ncbi:MAG: AMP-binding protein [Pseudomonadales bacterium]|nr:AMP-binding protein [Pseudomonadales bacterium]
MSQVWAAIRQFAEQRPDQIAISTLAGNRSAALSWRELEAAVLAVKKILQEQSIRSLALYADNSPDWVVIDLACRLAGVVLIPLPAFFSDRQLRHLLDSTSVDALITDQPDRVLPLWQAQPVLIEAPDGLNILVATDSNKRRSSCTMPAATGKISFTSGSTGMPKGVCLSSAHIEQVACSIKEISDSCAISRHLAVMPLSTLLENVAGVYTTLLSGAELVLATAAELGFNGSSGFSIERFLGAVQSSQANSLILIPQLLEALVHSCQSGWTVPKQLRFIAVGGGTVSPTLLQQARSSGLPVYEGYGLSECGSVVCLNGPGRESTGSLGKPLGHVRLVIENGEIVVSGSSFLGYVNDRSSWLEPGAETWVHTGDLGYIDGQGFVHYQGRIKNVMVSTYGRNIMPEWIEAEIQASPLISQCVVFGNDRPCCVALLAPSAPDIDNDQIDRLLVRVNAELPDYARIRAWHRLPSALPPGRGEPDDLMTSNGRPRRKLIQAHFEQEIEALYSECRQGGLATESVFATTGEA